MEYDRYFTAIFRFCFVLPIFWRFSNATIPRWCQKPAPIEHFAISASVNATDFKPHDGLVYLCQVKGARDPSPLFAVYDGEESLIEFNAADITFKMMSDNIFWMSITPTNRDHRHLKGKFRKFEDFVSFHRIVRRDPRFSPQRFAIKALESYANVRGAYGVDVSEAFFTRSVVFSQYSIDLDVVDDDESTFVIEDEFVDDEFIDDFSDSEEGGRESYFSFHPSQFRSARHQIYSQVVLTRADDENMYYIIRLGSPEEASNFANYIGQFATTESHGLMIPPALENFLLNRK